MMRSDPIRTGGGGRKRRQRGVVTPPAVAPVTTVPGLPIVVDPNVSTATLDGTVNGSHLASDYGLTFGSPTPGWDHGRVRLRAAQEGGGAKVFRITSPGPEDYPSAISANNPSLASTKGYVGVQETGATMRPEFLTAPDRTHKAGLDTVAWRTKFRLLDGFRASGGGKLTIGALMGPPSAYYANEVWYDTAATEPYWMGKLTNDQPLPGSGPPYNNENSENDSDGPWNQGRNNGGRQPNWSPASGGSTRVTFSGATKGVEYKAQDELGVQRHYVIPSLYLYAEQRLNTGPDKQFGTHFSFMVNPSGGGTAYPANGGWGTLTNGTWSNPPTTEPFTDSNGSSQNIGNHPSSLYFRLYAGTTYTMEQEVVLGAAGTEGGSVVVRIFSEHSPNNVFEWTIPGIRWRNSSAENFAAGYFPDGVAQGDVEATEWGIQALTVQHFFGGANRNDKGTDARAEVDFYWIVAAETVGELDALEP